MNRNMRIATLVAVALAAGLLAGRYMGDGSRGPAETSGPEPQERQILYWVAPMDPNFRSDKPGKSPMGMDLVPVYADEQEAGEGITISPAVENNLGVRTQAAAVRPLWRRIEATGYVGFDETRITHINLRTQGWIMNLAVDAEGERVSSGDLLFEIYSPELVNAQKEFVQAHQRGDERLKRGAHEKLRALGMIHSEIDVLQRTGRVSENIQVVAPQDGIIAALGVREGMYVQPNTPIMSLADLSSVWLQAEIFESQAEWVAAGQAAEARLDYMPGSVFSGQVDYVYPVLDPATRTLRVRLRFDNAEERLKPNMYARVSLFGRLRPSALTIPREALIRGGERDRVVVSIGDGRFHVHEVLTGMESGEWVEIVAGIEEGDQVVTSAQFLLDSEASLAGSIHRLESDPMRAGSEEPVRAFGSGWIDAVDVESRKLRVSHGPIDQLGWPSMTMDFKVDSGVDLDAFEVGQDIQFSLRQSHAGEFVIEHARLRQATENVTEAFINGDHETEAEPEVQRYVGQGRVVRVEPAENLLRMEHDPIEALGWPTMTMNFRVLPGVDISHVEPGQGIHFSLVKQDDRYVIDQVHVMTESAEAEEHDHD
ncbi:MAG: efflux RND transporter periplasmic adaptor subunit [Xanthomonadales bacterium]|nr:efflux RND transporter periplasmic adaptor subunit [Xanthomonadales bacterium]NIN73815.1 efflux RND transporter periplasmic adaptor subunit [Xanthomonadales bacterium]NIP10919.1 efflux RND transporter periplasmic adaptor subunit [Xanthomonadales bacterium]NIT07223.1 efflux RND transporter periplasmic adaptor subunit [Xanthomonadales bacterium]NIT32699.1 efflux RND transporter periplasmic adaptor subunit [Xanthomonadales bacterium]